MYNRYLEIYVKYAYADDTELRSNFVINNWLAVKKKKKLNK